MRTYLFATVGAGLLIAGTALAAPPAAPTIGAVTSIGCKSNRVAFTDNQGTGANAETGFRLERSASAGGPWSTATTRAGVSGTGARAVTNLPSDVLPPVEDVTYYYRVCATNTAGANCSAASSAFLTPICAPVSLTVQALLSSCNALRLSWTDKSSVNTAYYVERRLNNSGAFSLAFVTNSPVGALDGGPVINTGLSASTLYGYRIRAYNSGTGNFSGYSNTNAATVTACNATK